MGGREQDIKALAQAVLDLEPEYLEMADMCQFCLSHNYHEGSIDDILHELDCPKLIAKDLLVVGI